MLACPEIPGRMHSAAKVPARRAMWPAVEPRCAEAGAARADTTEAAPGTRRNTTSVRQNTRISIMYLYGANLIEQYERKGLGKQSKEDRLPVVEAETQREHCSLLMMSVRNNTSVWSVATKTRQA